MPAAIRTGKDTAFRSISRGTDRNGAVLETKCLVKAGLNTHLRTLHGGNTARLIVGEGMRAVHSKASSGWAATRLLVDYRRPILKGDWIFLETAIGNGAENAIETRSSLAVKRGGTGFFAVGGGMVFLPAGTAASAESFPYFWPVDRLVGGPKTYKRHSMVRTISEAELKANPFGEQVIAWLVDDVGGHCGQFPKCQSTTKSMAINYFQPVAAGDTLHVDAKVHLMEGVRVYVAVSVSFSGAMKNGRVAEGHLLLFSVDETGRPMRLPDSVLAMQPKEDG